MLSPFALLFLIYSVFLTRVESLSIDRFYVIVFARGIQCIYKFLFLQHYYFIGFYTCALVMGPIILQTIFQHQEWTNLDNPWCFIAIGKFTCLSNVLWCSDVLVSCFSALTSHFYHDNINTYSLIFICIVYPFSLIVSWRWKLSLLGQCILILCIGKRSNL